MKHKLISVIATITAGLVVCSCAGLGLGVDVDSSGASPYFYGSTSINPGWNYGPIWNTWGWGNSGWNRPSNPPVVGNGPGSALPNRPVQRPVVNRPQNPPVNNGGGNTNLNGGLQNIPGTNIPNINGSNPGPVTGGTGIPSASQRPGHMGRN